MRGASVKKERKRLSIRWNMIDISGNSQVSISYKCINTFNDMG
jgi:hypothetical protein